MIGRIVNYFKQSEHNVKLAYAFTITFWSSRSIIFEQVLSGYIFVLTNSNKPVGIVKGVQGIVQMIAAIPGGYAVDRYRRDIVLKISGFIGLLCAILTIIAFDIGHLNLIYFTYGCWGLFCAFQRPALEALFADSVPNGERSFPFTVKYNLMNVALAVGPLISVVLFMFSGDSWSIPELRLVLICGTIIGIPPLLLLFFFNDDLAYENYQAAGLPRPRALSSVDVENCNIEYSYNTNDDEYLSEKSVLIDGLPAGKHGVSNGASSINTSHIVTKEDIFAQNTFFCFGPRHVPYLLFASDFIICNGAGMTINFFPIFFQQEYNLTPAQVNLLWVIQPLLIVIMSFLTQKIAMKVGAIETVVTTRIGATFCLLYMSFGNTVYLEIALFLMRGSMMRCSEPLRLSILMDYVPQNLRGRWNALEGLTMFTYSGSAVIGGYLIEKHGYRYCFFITAIVYFCGLCMELLLLPITRNATKRLQQANMIQK